MWVIYSFEKTLTRSKNLLFKQFIDYSLRVSFGNVFKIFCGAPTIKSPSLLDEDNSKWALNLFEKFFDWIEKQILNRNLDNFLNANSYKPFIFFSWIWMRIWISFETNLWLYSYVELKFIRVSSSYIMLKNVC